MPTPRSKPTLTVLAALAVASLSCIGRTLPIPPPGAQFSATSECAVVDCPSGGVIVTVTGSAVSGALVVVENLSQAARGSRYSSSAFAATPTDVSAGRARAPGDFVVRLGPRPERADSPTPVLISQRGDRITVYQFVAQADGTWAQSLPLPAPIVVP